MTELNELYQEVLLDHNRNPRNFKALDNPSGEIEGYNPLCGDKYTVFVRVNDNVIEDIGFEGAGCAISKASASMMTDAVKGKTKEEVDEIYEDVHRMLTNSSNDTDAVAKLGKLAALSGVAAFPMRVKCATLAWHAMRVAMQGENDKISTE